MNTADIRRAFEDFCGTERFEKFVDVVQTFVRDSGRLRYWQEQLWADFRSQYPGELPPGDDTAALVELFRLCPLHRVELERDLLRPIRHMPPSYDRSYEYAGTMQFPYACDETYVGRDYRGSTFIEVFYCPRCHEVKAELLLRDSLPEGPVPVSLVLPEEPFPVEFGVPWPAAHRVHEGMQVLLHRQGEDRPHPTRIVQLERCRDGLFAGPDGLVHFVAVLDGIASADPIPDGTGMEFVAGGGEATWRV